MAIALSDTIETFVECPVCSGFYVSLKLHLKYQWKRSFGIRKDYTSDSTLLEDFVHAELYKATFPEKPKRKKANSNKKFTSLSEKQRAYWKRRNERVETERELKLSCGHSTIAWTTDETSVPICSTCGLVPQ